MYDVNIVVVNYKMQANIEKCFASLFDDFKNDSLNVHIVVVDNASGDNIEQFLKSKYPTVTFISKDKNQGFGFAQNIGLGCVDAKYHFALNPDTYFYPESHTIKKLYDFMEKNPKIGMIGPKILYPDGSLQYSCWRLPTLWQPIFSRTKFGKQGRGKIISDWFLMKDFDHNKTMPVDAIMGSAMFVRGVAMKAVGMFDDRFFMYFEDIDWSHRMWEAHWPVYYVHDIVLEHLHGRLSAKVPGIFRPLFQNKLARIHMVSWLKYMWKWRGNRKYYVTR